jgi:hypothetical protein
VEQRRPRSSSSARRVTRACSRRSCGTRSTAVDVLAGSRARTAGRPAAAERPIGPPTARTTSRADCRATLGSATTSPTAAAPPAWCREAKSASTGTARVDDAHPACSRGTATRRAAPRVLALPSSSGPEATRRRPSCLRPKGEACIAKPLGVRGNGCRGVRHEVGEAAIVEGDDLIDRRARPCPSLRGSRGTGHSSGSAGSASRRSCTRGSATAPAAGGRSPRVPGQGAHHTAAPPSRSSGTASLPRSRRTAVCR